MNVDMTPLKELFLLLLIWPVKKLFLLLILLLPQWQMQLNIKYMIASLVQTVRERPFYFMT